MIIGDLVKQTQDNLNQVGMDYGIGVVMELDVTSFGSTMAVVWWPNLIPKRYMTIRTSKIEVVSR